MDWMELIEEFGQGDRYMNQPEALDRFENIDLDIIWMEPLRDHQIDEIDWIEVIIQMVFV